MRLRIRVLLTLCIGSVGAGPAVALDPARSIAQYKHTVWTIDEGAPRNVNALAQGASGYLWIGSSAGLFRFDGLSFEQIKPQVDAASSVSALRVARNGDVWVGYANGGTSVYRNGRLLDVPMSEPTFVMDLVQTPDGSIWATLGRREHQIMRYQNGQWKDVGAILGFPIEQPMKMIVARDGTLWVTTLKSLVYLRAGASRFERSSEVVTGHGALSEDRTGKIWLSDESGSRAVRVGASAAPAAVPYPTPAAQRRTATLFDRDGNLWGMTHEGIFRVRTPLGRGDASAAAAALATTRFGQKEGLSADRVNTLFEDREGNIWIGTALGLERFRAARVVSEPLLTKPAFWGDVLLGASDGTVYVGETDGIYRIKAGGNPQLLLSTQDPQAICEGSDHSIWMVLKDRIVRRHGDQSTSMVVPKTDQGASDCAVDERGQLWLATLRNGMFGRVGNAWHQILIPAPPDDFTPLTLLHRRDGNLLISSENTGLARLEGADTAKYLIHPDNTFGNIRSLFETNDGLLFGGGSGLGEIRDNKIRVLNATRFPWLGFVSGIVQTDGGQTWLGSPAGLVGMPTAALNRAVADPRSPLVPTILDFRDGLTGVPYRDSNRAVVKGGDGRVWFATTGGTVWIDPGRLSRNSLPPPVAIASLDAQSSSWLDPTQVSLHAGTSSVEIRFAALSLSIPERVQVRYMLEGSDGRWIDPGARRQAFYTNLGPGHYRFRVIAANDDGVWNRTGAAVEFNIPPTFLQSRWFAALCALGIAALLWCAYLLRVRQIKAGMRNKLEERLAERERIARDLHDTMLQGFQGLIMRFQAVANAIPHEQPARGMIDQTLDSADEVLSEGRDSVRQLRAAAMTELPEALKETAERLRRDYPIEFKMAVEGTPQPLHPVVREEACRIADEALINAFQHGRAKIIELAIAYKPAALVLGVRDDGIGIDSEIFEGGGRQGHFGLVGMRERAQQIGAEFNISSRLGSGTEIQLRVPGGVAYVEASGGGLKKLVSRILRRGA